MRVFGVELSPEPVPDATPSVLPCLWSAARTCRACLVDWSSEEACFCCGADGTKVHYLPAADQAIHRLCGQAVHRRNLEEPSPL